MPDTLMHDAHARIDSLHQSFALTSDSIRASYNEKVKSLASLKLKYLNRIDSIKNNKPSAPDNPLDTLHAATEIDAYAHKADSLDQQMKNLQYQTTDKLNSLKGSVNEKIGELKLPKAAEGKVASLATVMNKVNVPAFNAELTGSPGLPLNNSIPDIGTALPGVTIPGTNLPTTNANIPGINASGLKDNIPSTGIDMGKINDVTGKTGNLQEQVKEATASQEALGNTLENKAAEQLKGLPDKKLPETPGMPDGIPRTGDEAKEQLVTQAKKQAMNHFAGKEAVLMNAMEKMGKYKQQYESVNSLKEIKDNKKTNPMRGKTLRERLVPAITWQFQSWHEFMLDINPSVGYKLNSNIVIGLGWNQRVAFNLPDKAFNRYANVHGLRSYGEYNFKKGLGFRLDLECMNTPLKKRNTATDVPPQRDWVWSALIGIKQKYPIYKKLKGNAQLMYNLFDKDHRSPYTDRINWRIGLEFTFKKKGKVKQQEPK